MLVAPPSKKKASKKSKRKAPKGRPEEEEVSSKPRSPNFAPWEDLILCKARVSVSLDPSVGCNQKRASF